MSKVKRKTIKPKRVSKRNLVNTRKKHSNDDFLTGETEILRTLEIKADFSTTDNIIRTAKFALTKDIRFNRSKEATQLTLNIFTLLSGNKSPNPLTLIIFLIQNKFISPNELKSLIPKNTGGRKRKYLNRETGEILNMKQPNKQICELYSQGKEPEEIRDVIFPAFRSENGKMKKLFFVRRILRENKDFLTRTFN